MNAILETKNKFTYNNSEHTLLAQHDAMCDVFVPPLGRVAGLRSQMAGINMYVKNTTIDKSHNREELRNKIIDFLNTYLECPEVTLINEFSEDENCYQICAMQTNSNIKSLAAFIRFKDSGQSRSGTTVVGTFNSSLHEELNKLINNYLPKKLYTISHIDVIDGDIEETIYTLDEKEIKLIPEFYPFIKEGPEKLIKDFFDSRDSVLILTGIQGSGKSSLFKNMLEYGKDYKFIIVDNPGIYQSSDSFALLVRYLRNLATNESVIVALEEVDAFVKEKNNENVMLPRLLNLSAGAVKSNIKFVLMSNIPTADQFSEALVRDGRTFKAIDFKKLSPIEANKARNAIGYNSVEFVKPQILATALKKETICDYKDQVGKIGFNSVS